MSETMQPDVEESATPPSPSASNDDNVVPEDQAAPASEKCEDPPRDDEGLLLEYDVILCDTGLVQSILASALARAGKSVLHCDGAEQYGGLDAVWSFPYLEEMRLSQKDDTEQQSVDQSKLQLALEGPYSTLRIHSHGTKTEFDLEQGCWVQTPVGKGKVVKIPSSESADQTQSVAVSLENWKMADGKSPVAHFGIQGISSIGPELTEYMRLNHQVESMRSINSKNILDSQSRHLALDVTPTFILAAGRAVQGMLASGVAEYVEFKTLDGLNWLDGKSFSEISRVPCSKNDVFSTKLLKPMDKRRLMKFLQLTMDYSVSVSPEGYAGKEEKDETENEAAIPSSSAVEDVQSLNERHLNQGRSLARPQNKTVATNELQKLQEYLQGGKLTFEEYLQKEFNLSAQLGSLVRYALALNVGSSSTTLLDGMTRLRQHLQALGRYGSTAFLVPMYGSGELSQAFCRSAAVFGATYLLRRAPLEILSSEQGAVNGVLLRGDDSEDALTFSSTLEHKQTKSVSCRHVVASAESILKLRDAKRVERRMLRRISILRGSLLPAPNGEQRQAIIIPPRSTDIGNEFAIHGVVLDDSVHVSPCGCTILHLSTTVQVDENAHIDVTILQKACQSILNGSQDIDEIYHISFSYAAYEKSESPIALPEGLHVCHHPGQTLAADTAFAQAYRLFQKICPGMEFLGLSEEMDTIVKERSGDRVEDDDERMMLDSAVGMIDKRTTESSQQ